MTVRSVFLTSAAALAVALPVLVAAPTAAMGGLASTEAVTTPGSWEPPVALNGASVQQWSFVVDARNRSTFVWRDSSGAIVSARRWPGGSWSSQEVVGTGSYPRVAADADGKVTAVWLTQRDGYTSGVMAAQRTPGSGWSHPVRISHDLEVPGYPGAVTSPGGAFRLSLAVSPRGATVVAWDWGSKPLDKRTRVQSVYRPSGHGWGKVVDVSRPWHSGFPQVGIAANGTAVLLYSRESTGHLPTLLSRRRLVGKGWTVPVTVAVEAYGQLAVDRAGNAVVVLTRRDGRVVATYQRAGGHWGALRRLSPPGGGVFWPSLAMGGGRTIMVALTSDDGHVYLTSRSSERGWSVPQVAVDSVVPPVTLSLDGRGDMFLGYGESDVTGRYRPDGDSWSAPMTVSPDQGGVNEELTSQVAPNGDVVVVWGNENAPVQVRVMVENP
jgi:hypothetical protein